MTYMTNDVFRQSYHMVKYFALEAWQNAANNVACGRIILKGFQREYRLFETEPGGFGYIVPDFLLLLL